MKKLIFTAFFIFSALLGWSQDKQISIKGKITNGEQPINGVNILVANTERGTQTNANGEYELTAQEGEVLRYSHVGYVSIEIITEDVNRTLNIIMVPEVNELKEVTVTKSVPRKTQKELFQDYNNNPNLIKTMFGIVDKEIVGYSLRILNKEDISQGAMDIKDVINGRFAGVQMDCNRTTGLLVVAMRSTLTFGGANSDPTGNAIVSGPSDHVVFDVDGILFEELPCNFVDPSNIERIAVIPSLSGLIKYGTIGRGGAVIINTVTGNFSPRANGVANFDQAKLRNNTFQNDALTSADTARDVAGYLAALRSSESEAGAKQLYEQQIKMYGSSFYYLLDAYDYFASKWKNQEFADQIIKDNYTLFSENPIALKSLAYMYQTQGESEKAHEAYKEVFILRPNYAQSYMDLANSYREVGDYRKAASIYARYGYLLEQGFLRAEGKMFTNIIDRELNNLVSLKGKEILSRKELKSFVLDEEFSGTRLVFEWADSEAEFELQFVNPENNFFKSEHSLIADANRIKDEKLSGYSSEEYLIDDAIRGTWMVNVKYLGNKSLTPTYIKATIYHNYGSASQRKETKLFKMSLRNVNQQWFKVSNAGTIAAN
ncbi:carboxypeptidase-like regulatory domain-containing protein [bacterium]|nr:carboxypeptidase-like regulatory domain-containing protein [bacterium]